jgi:hypothetical protein
MPLSPPFVIRISSPAGDTYVREGDEPGKGPVSQFPSMQDALTVIEACRPGLAEDEYPAVVPYEAVPKGER